MVEVVVFHNYDGREDDELTIRVGDIISNVVKSDGGWWEGHLHGRKGVFPDNFVEEIKRTDHIENLPQKQAAYSVSQFPGYYSNQVPKAIPSSPPSYISKFPMRRARAAFSYEPQNNDELKLSVNDIIEVISEEEEGWWRGVLNGKTGVFPSNFVEPLDPGNGVKSGGDMQISEIKGKKIRDIRFGLVDKQSPSHQATQPVASNKSQFQPFKQREPDELKSEENRTARATDMTSHAPPSLPPKLREAKPVVVERARVVFSYVAENEDELTLNVGDTITILQKKLEDAGWWKGEIRGRIGVFPDNFVELLPPDNKPVVKPGYSEAEQLLIANKRVERPPPPDPSKVSALSKPSKPEEKKVKPQVPSQPPMLLGKKTSDLKPESKPVILTDDHKATDKATKDVVSGLSLPDTASSNPKLLHLTANRVRAPSRRPPTVYNMFQQVDGKGPQKDADSVGPAALSRPPHPPAAAVHPPPTALYPSPTTAQVTVTEKMSHPPMTRTTASTPETTRDFVGEAAKPEPALKATASPTSSDGDATRSVAKGDLLSQLQIEVMQLKQELEQIKSSHRVKVQELVHEINEEKKAQKMLLEDVEKLKKIVFERFGKL